MPIAGKALAIRADGGAGIGAGHVMRCVALADAWQRAGGQVDWFCRPLPRMLSAMLQSRQIAMHEVDDDWRALERWAGDHRGSWACIDGYDFTDGPARVKAAGARALVIADDMRWGRYECDALINQVIGAEALSYDIPPQATQMLGTSFCLLRREFVEVAVAQSRRQAVATVFVSFGGDDAHGLSARVASLLPAHFPSIHIDATAGVIASDAVSRNPAVAFHTATDLSSIIGRADVAIVAAGSVCWELAYLGVPALTITVADNQEPIAGGLAAAGVTRSLGWFDRVSDAAIVEAFRQLSNDAALRQSMSERGRRLVDGRGADRVVETLLRAA